MPAFNPNALLQNLATSEGTRAATATSDAAASRSSAFSSLQNFDPSSYIKQQADALVTNESENLGKIQTARKFSLNRRGLLASDIGGAQTQRDFNQRVATGIDSLAGEAAGLKSQSIGQGIQLAGQDAQTAESATTNYGELLAGDRDYEMQKANAKTQKTLGYINAGANLIKGIGSLFSPIHL